MGLGQLAKLPGRIAALQQAAVWFDQAVEGCPWLVTFDLRHFQPGHPAVTVLRPGELVGRVRERLAHLPAAGPAVGGEEERVQQGTGEM